MKCRILLEKRLSQTSNYYDSSGNVLLNQLFGAKIEYRESSVDMSSEGKQVCLELEKQGANPYFVPGGGSNTVGALSYVECALELSHQMNTQSLVFNHLIHATGSTGTQAGLVVGLESTHENLPVFGISVKQTRDKQIDAIYKLVQKTTEKMNYPDVSRDCIPVDDGYVGKGYKISNELTMDAIRLLTQTEGILLDPVYSGKGMAGLIDYVHKGLLNKKEKIIFLHTGGCVALFAYAQVLKKIQK